MATVPEIKARHDEATKLCGDEWGEDCISYGVAAHSDRAALLTHLDAMAGALQKVMRSYVWASEKSADVAVEAAEVLKQAGYDT